MFYDTHAHLGYADFEGDLHEVLERAREAGVTKVITIGTDLETSHRAIQISETYPNVYATVGWHPSDAARAPADVRPELRVLARHPKVVGIGEIGLDYYRLPSRREGGHLDEDGPYMEKQKTVFRQQLDLAAELGLNCVVHQRDSFEDTLLEVQPYSGRLRTVFHCFGNPPADAQRVLALGSLVSFTGIVTFKNAQTAQASAAALSPSQFMLETDAPFLAPVPFRGKRCEPAYVRETAKAIATLQGISMESLGDATCAAAHSFFPKLLS